MAWRQPGDKSLSKPMMGSLLTHICVTGPQWFNTMSNTLHFLMSCVGLWGRVPRKCRGFNIFCLLHPDVVFLEPTFFYQVCLSCQYLQNEPIYKSLLQFWLFSYSGRTSFEAKNRKCGWRGGTKRTWKWPNLHMHFLGKGHANVKNWTACNEKKKTVF